MGGNAFTSGPNPVSTPRMPPEVYFMLRDHYNHILRTLYKRVATPIEAPNKTSYGDVDILVSEPLIDLPGTETLARLLKAERTFKNHGSPTTSFAVQYPNDPGSYVQIDIHVCTAETFEWQLFHQSHGDLWNLLGTAIRPAGLTANDKGLHLRIEGIESLDRKKSMILLTRDPDAVVRFLGLDSEASRQSFGSIEQMYAFVRACRFFNPGRYMRDGLKANDRKRMAQREIYRRFVEEWVPRCGESVGEGEKLLPEREEVLKEALDTFGMREEYDMRLKAWKEERMDLAMRQDERIGRKQAWAEVAEYADAWISSFEHGE